MMEAAGISIEVNALAKRFNRDWIFRKLSYSFKPSTTYGVTGPNGSGKSTLLHVLWGQTPPSSGSLSYKKGNAVISHEEIYREIAIATPYMDLIEEFTLEEQISFHFRLRRIRENITEEELIPLFGLSHAKGKAIGNFSSGMKQRLKLGLAFYTSADILFLDEPCTNLDKKGFDWYFEQLKSVQKNTLLLIASNDPAEYSSANEMINILDFK